MVLRLMHISIATLFWLVLIVKTADLLRQPHNWGLRHLVMLCLGLSIALTVGIPPIYATIDWLTHVPNLAKLLQHLATISACGAGSVMMIRLDRDAPRPGARVRRRIALAGAVATAMTVLFFLAPVDESEPIRFADRYSTAAFIPQYMLLFIAMIAVVCADVAISTWRYGRRRRGANVPLRMSVGLMFAAAIFGIAYCLFKAAYIVIRLLGESPLKGENALSTPLALAAVILGATSLALPKVGASIDAILHRLDRLRAYRRLHPLWSDLYAAMPEIVLNPPRGRDLMAILDIDYRLYRRVIEISDGMLALGIVGLPRHAHPDPRRAAAVAETLATGLQRMEKPAAASAVTTQAPAQQDRSLDDEIKWLILVADAYEWQTSHPSKSASEWHR
ncbi:hypothetical protein OHA25_07500 [Nonomuraea sp. NBC_00507]|uniref:MAB_1171c family putative transporter n=1 Tax=Nonomuraea sp. NBC_00507 TaxID=2976002 RepID=UPI002E16F943